MTETPEHYDTSDSEALLRSPLTLPYSPSGMKTVKRGEAQASADRIPRPQKLSWESQLQALPPDVRSVAESLSLRDPESARRYVGQYLAANRGVRT